MSKGLVWLVALLVACALVPGCAALGFAINRQAEGGEGSQGVLVGAVGGGVLALSLAAVGVRQRGRYKP